MENQGDETFRRKFLLSAMRTILQVSGAASVLALIFVLVNPTWSADVLHLFVHAWGDFLITEGSSTTGTVSNLGTGVVIVLLTILFILRHKGSGEMMKHWKEEAPIAMRVAIMAALLIYGPVLIWKCISIVHADHIALQDLQGCKMANLGMKPPATAPVGMKSADIVVFWCGTDYEAPLTIEWNFNVAPTFVTLPSFPDVLPVREDTYHHGLKTVAYVERPSLLKNQPTILNIYSDAELSPQATSIVIRPLSKSSKPVPVVIHATDLR
jgi:hypothetical protein